MISKLFIIALSGLGGEGEADPVSGSAARRTSYSALGGDVRINPRHTVDHPRTKQSHEHDTEIC